MLLIITKWFDQISRKLDVCKFTSRLRFISKCLRDQKNYGECQKVFFLSHLLFFLAHRPKEGENTITFYFEHFSYVVFFR